MIGWEHAELEGYSERLSASRVAHAWGFPRVVDPEELLLGRWYRMGWRAVWWLEAPILNLPGCLGLHLAVAPKYRRRWPVREWLFHVERAGLALGATSIIVAVPAGAWQIDAYLARLGWIKEQSVRVLRLGVRDGRFRPKYHQQLG